MSLDSQLLDLMRQFAGLKVENLDQIHSKVENILFRWAKVDGVNPTSRGAFLMLVNLVFLKPFFSSHSILLLLMKSKLSSFVNRGVLLSMPSPLGF